MSHKIILFDGENTQLVMRNEDNGYISLEMKDENTKNHPIIFLKSKEVRQAIHALSILKQAKKEKKNETISN